MIIEYKDKSIKTKFYKQITNKQYKHIKNSFYKKPPIENVNKQFLAIANGGCKNNFIVNYYFKELMSKTRLYYNNWCIDDVLNYKPLVEVFIGKTLCNKNVFPDNMPTCKKFETALRLGGKGIASKPANFPIKTVYEILNKYNINNNYYDYSCGWGSRLLASLSLKINYYGTDPNYLLVNKLIDMASDYQAVTKNEQFV